MNRMAIVGSGHIAHALWEGWQNHSSWDIRVLARSDAHRHLWDDKTWHHTVTFDSEVVEAARLIVLAVKPQDVESTWHRINPRLASSAVVVSPVAGWTLERLRSLGIVNPLARVMPNVCAAVNASTTLATFSGIPDEAAELIMALFSHAGTLTLVEESLMDPYTALLGSGPAYVFLLLEALVASGEALGADAEQTRTLVSGMVEGAARLARERQEQSLSDWIREVTSPGGTTEALLAVLKQGGWSTIMQEAVVAASTRAQKMGQRR